MFKASIIGAFILVVGRIFGAAREVILAQRLGPTEAVADYVLASNVYLPLCGLLGGVASALMLRRKGGALAIASILVPVSLVLSTISILGVGANILPSGEIHLVFAFSLPFYAIYGISSGALLARGRAPASMVFSVLPPFFGFLGLLTPDSTTIFGVVIGNLVGSILMACAAYFVAFGGRRSVRTVRWSPTLTVGREALAIAVVSAINIGSPIVDRFFANQLGTADLVLLNLGAILFLGVVGTLGMAIGNAAVGRESTGGSRFRSSMLFPLPIVVAFVIVVTAQPVADVLALGPMYEAADRLLLAQILELYGLASAPAILAQVMIRVWNISASARAMVFLAGGLFSLNVVANVVLVPSIGVLGIVISTLLVQIFQLLILGSLTKRPYLACLIVLATLLGGIYVFTQ